MSGVLIFFKLWRPGKFAFQSHRTLTEVTQKGAYICVWCPDFCSYYQRLTLVPPPPLPPFPLLQLLLTKYS